MKNGALPSCSLAALVAAALLSAPTTVAAAEFDTHTGEVRLDGSAVSFGFERGQPTSALGLFDRRGNAVAPEALDAALVDTAIEGGTGLAVGNAAFLARVDLTLLGATDRLHGRRVEIKYWSRAAGSRVVAHVIWTADGQNALAELPFQLSGRATDDGWVEWTSGPFDYSMGGLVNPSSLLFYSNQGGFGGGGGMSTVAAPFGVIDALSLDDLGAAAVPSARCNLATEASTCGTAGACYLGRCTDASVALGPMFQNPSLRADYLARRTYEYNHLEGGRVPEGRAAELESRLGALADETSVIRYRTQYWQALQILEDGHASPPISRDGGSRATGICVHLGVADLLPGAATTPLVFAVSNTSSIAARVRPGDALVAIDGMPVDEWAQAAGRYVAFYGDQRARAVDSAPDLMVAAAAVGSVVSFDRPTCRTATTTPVAACAPSEIERIDIDLGEAEAGAWSGPLPPWLDDPIFCDYRFHRAFPGPDGTAYEFAGSVDRDGVRTLQINGVPSAAGQAGQAWSDAIDAAFTSAPPRLILDQRTGFGGGIDAVDHLAGYMVGPPDFDRMELCPRTAQPVDEPLLGSLSSCQAGGALGLSFNGCGEYIEWVLGSGRQNAVARTSSVAVLVGYDVSGNDFLTKLLTYRKAGGLRIFGGAPTAGAFGVIWSLPAVSHELSGGSLQVQDSIFRDSRGDQNLDFQTAHGVPPDEVVLQLQSDALRDVDTVYEAALSWLKR